MRKTFFSVALLLTAVGGLLAGVLWLIHLRFETGQAYAASSSLRSDPLGAKVLFDSFDALNGVTVERNFTPFIEVNEWPPDATVLMLNVNGVSLYQLARYEPLEQFVRRGGRLVIALNPGNVAYKYIENDSIEEDTADTEDEAESDEEESITPFVRRANEDQEAFWGELELLYGEHTGGEALRAAAAASQLPLSLPWREGGVMNISEDESWASLYSIEDEVVAAERTLGQGNIVLFTDNYLFSNEALLNHRYTSLLAWVLGRSSIVIFDETHLGVAETTGIMTLMRRYKLSGFLISCVILLAVFVWRGMSPLLPPFAGRTKNNVVFAEHSTEAGLGDLVRRSATSVDLPHEAFGQWKQSFVRTPMDQVNYAKEMEAVNRLFAAYDALPKRKRNPLKLHFDIQTIINRKKMSQL